MENEEIKKSVWGFLFKMFSTLIVGFLIAILIMTLMEPGLVKKDLKNNIAPGVFVKLQSRDIHLNCTGEGEYTIILESDIMRTSLYWQEVQTELAKTNRICSYDRAGIAWSDVSPFRRTLKNISKDLHDLLEEAGEQGPYILVGDDFGAEVVRYYASEYPEEVSGILLLEYIPWKIIDEFAPEELSKFQDLAKEDLFKLKGMGLLSRIGFLRHFTFSFNLEKLGVFDESQEIKDLYKVMTHYNFWDTAVEEIEARKESVDLFIYEALLLEPKPVHILMSDNIVDLSCSGQFDSDYVYNKRNELLAEFLRISKNNKMIALKDSDENIVENRASDIIAEVLEIIQIVDSLENVDNTINEEEGEVVEISL